MTNGIPVKKFYGLFDAEGKPQGFYVDDIYLPKEDGSRNDAIPAAAVEITEEQWQMLVSNQQTARFVDGEVITIVLPAPMPSAQYSWGPTLVEVIGTEN